jgi:hypothetical protein
VDQNPEDGALPEATWLETNSTTSVDERGSGCLSSEGTASAEQEQLGVLEDGTNHFGGAGRNWGLVWRPGRFGGFGAAREINVAVNTLRCGHGGGVPSDQTRFAYVN